MKKYLFIVLVCLSFFSIGQTISKGEKQLQIGVGLGSTILPYGFKTVVPPIQISYGAAIADNFVLAGFLAYANKNYDYEDYLYSKWPVLKGDYVHYRWTSSHVLFGVEGRYYFGEALNITSKFNPYAKLMLGYNAVSYRREVIKSHIEELYYPYLTPAPQGGTFAGIAIGTTYSATDNVAVFAELGYAISLLQLGIHIKM